MVVAGVRVVGEVAVMVMVEGGADVVAGTEGELVGTVEVAGVTACVVAAAADYEWSSLWMCNRLADAEEYLLSSPMSFPHQRSVHPDQCSHLRPLQTLANSLTERQWRRSHSQRQAHATPHCCTLRTMSVQTSSSTSLLRKKSELPGSLRCLSRRSQSAIDEIVGQPKRHSQRT